MEANNKVFKMFRERFARKTSREENLQDVFARISACSDPVLLKHFHKMKKIVLREKKSFSPRALDLLKPIDIDYMK